MRAIVVGGGPVGLYAATLAALSGMDVTLFEARTGDGDKACGEGLMPLAVSALGAIGVEPRGRPFSGIRYLDATGKRQVRADIGCGLGVRRTELVRALREAALRTGVSTTHSRVSSVRQQDASVTVTAQDGRHDAEVVFGCDGLSSTVRRSAGLEAQAGKSRRYGLVAHYEVEPWSSDVEVYWGSGGEGYVTPVSEYEVGVALLGGPGASFDDRLDELPALRHRLEGSRRVGRSTGAGPLSRGATTPGRGRVMLVGDAAGYVDALTGEGLAVGFVGARLAVDAASTGAFEQYPSAWMQATRRTRWSTDTLVRSTQRRPLRRALLPMASMVPAAFARAVRAATS
ncbi:MAG: NAD(P)/FAD-dependent oxidoreductase [Actinomycetia bacterium]|nr:NAD(P)/FAD-dependent oxidoreductase [Actinomycetes bacterium]